MARTRGPREPKPPVSDEKALSPSRKKTGAAARKAQPIEIISAASSFPAQIEEEGHGDRRGHKEHGHGPRFTRVSPQDGNEKNSEREEPHDEGPEKEELPFRDLPRRDGESAFHAFPFAAGDASPTTATKISSRESADASASTTPSSALKRANDSSP